MDNNEFKITFDTYDNDQKPIKIIFDLDQDEELKEETKVYKEKALVSEKIKRKVTNVIKGTTEKTKKIISKIPVKRLLYIVLTSTMAFVFAVSNNLKDTNITNEDIEDALNTPGIKIEIRNDLPSYTPNPMEHEATLLSSEAPTVMTTPTPTPLVVEHPTMEPIVDNPVINDVSNHIFEFEYDETTDWKKYENTIDKYGYYFELYGNMYGISPNLLGAMASQESGDHEGNLYGDKSIGLFQIQPADFANQKMRVFNFQTNSYEEFYITEDGCRDLATNVKYACAILRTVYREVKGNGFAAIMSYNIGSIGATEHVARYLYKTGQQGTKRENLDSNKMTPLEVQVFKDYSNTEWINDDIHHKAWYNKEYELLPEELSGGKQGDEHYLTHVLSYNLDESFYFVEEDGTIKSFDYNIINKPVRTR